MGIAIFILLWLLVGVLSLVFWMTRSIKRYPYTTGKQIVVAMLVGPLTFILLYVISMENNQSEGG